MVRYTAQPLCSMSNEKQDRLMLFMLFDAEDCNELRRWRRLFKPRWMPDLWIRDAPQFSATGESVVRIREKMTQRGLTAWMTADARVGFVMG